MRIIKILFLLSLILGCLVWAFPVLAETKPPAAGPGQVIPKIPKTPDDPILENGGVYPMWGPVCQRYTYHTTYRDKEGRPPEYVRMYFNGDWLDVPKENPDDNDYKKGVRYIYKFVPNKIGANFFFFEASNGVGKTREGIIDSPGNGPVLFESDFLHNQIALIDRKGAKVLNYPVGDEWVGGVALATDGKYLAAKTSRKIILFETTKPAKPLWIYEQLGEGGIVGGDVKGGIAISGDGAKILASIGGSVLLFDKKSQKPVWQAPIGNAYNVAISKDGKYAAAATAGSEMDENTNLLVLWKTDEAKPLWQYHASGNFHDVALSADGAWIAGSTGCPDRKAYIFTRDSKVPLVKSESLTYDSPVQRARISSDGSWAAFTTDGGPNSAMVALFSNNSQTPSWKFTTSVPKAARAMGMTPDAQSIVVANTVGDVYLLGRESNQPKAEWHLNTTIGTADIANDGSLIAVGSTDSKVHLLDPQTKTETTAEFDEFVEEVAVSGNGQYVAVGTGGSPYFFEEILSPNRNKVFTCDQIIEPKPLSEAMKTGEGSPINQASVSQLNWWQKIINFFQKLFRLKLDQGNAQNQNDQAPGGGKQGTGQCGDGICEPVNGENPNSCSKDCTEGGSNEQ